MRLLEMILRFFLLHTLHIKCRQYAYQKTTSVLYYTSKKNQVKKEYFLQSKYLFKSESVLITFKIRGPILSRLALSLSIVISFRIFPGLQIRSSLHMSSPFQISLFVNSSSCSSSSSFVFFISNRDKRVATKNFLPIG